ncbi:MAG TPA: SpoIIE family protein phosphatase [Trichocoleus sp.]
MVVDDESDNLDLLYRTFRRDFEVFKAESGLKALELLNQVGEMGIIISDQRMPKMNGTEFLSLTVEPFPDTIRILLTGYSDVEDLVGAINSGKVFKYITKPWNPDDLKTVVQQAAETYQLVKQRTTELNRALRRESTFNTVMTAIRGSLDSRSMLQTIAQTFGQTFAADYSFLFPLERINDGTRSYQRTAEQFCYPEAIDPQDSLAQLPIDLPALLSVSEFQEICLFPPTTTQPISQLIVPLTYQQEILALLVLLQQGQTHSWSVEEIALVKTVAEQAALALSQAQLYQRIQDQTEQMRAELAVARQIQSNLLRQTLPELESIRIQAHCYPAREVGGDFFEVYVHPLGDLWLAVGDVSGKGVPAALFMASAISLLRRELAQETPPPPNTVLQNLNRSLSEDLVSSNCFITMTLIRYLPATRELTYANAGHVYPMVWSQLQVKAQSNEQGTVAAIEPNYLKVRGVPLGILPVWKAAAGTLTLDPGDVLLLTSDGITEATMTTSAIEGIMLQQSGLWQLLMQQQGGLDLGGLLAHIQAHSQLQEDDQTILSLEVL